MATEPFLSVALEEQVRRERRLLAERRRLRLELLAQRNFIAGRLEERRLAQLASDPRSKMLSEKIQGLAAFAHLQDRANYLASAIDALARRRAVESSPALAERSPSAGEDP